MDTSILSNLIITDFVSATTIFTQKNAKSKKEDRCSWALVIKFEGETEYTCNGKNYISNIDNLMILPRGVILRVDMHKRGTLLHYRISM